MTEELVFLKNKNGSPKSLHWKCHAAMRWAVVCDKFVWTVLCAVG